MGIVQLAESQGAIHSENDPGPDQIAAILRDFQADLDAGLNINHACRKAGIENHHLLPLEGPPGKPYRMNNFA